MGRLRQGLAVSKEASPSVEQDRRGRPQARVVHGSENGPSLASQIDRKEPRSATFRFPEQTGHVKSLSITRPESRGILPILILGSLHDLEILLPLTPRSSWPLVSGPVSLGTQVVLPPGDYLSPF